MPHPGLFFKTPIRDRSQISSDVALTCNYCELQKCGLFCSLDH